jgi:hypothetical protein
MAKAVAFDIVQERGRENLSFPVAELFKPKGLKTRKSALQWQKR